MDTTSDNQQVSENVCSICLEEIALKERAVYVPCGHEFHYECASAWNRRHNDCSFCRQKVASIRYHIESDYLFDEDDVTGRGEDDSPMLQFAYTLIGSGIFLHSLQPLQVYEVINGSRRTVRLQNQLHMSSASIHAGAHFQLDRGHLSEMAHLTIETATASFSLASAMLRLQNQGQDSRGVFTETRALPLLDRLDGTLRLVHSQIPDAADNDSDSAASESSSTDADADDCVSQRMRRRNRRRSG